MERRFNRYDGGKRTGSRFFAGRVRACGMAAVLFFVCLLTAGKTEARQEEEGRSQVRYSETAWDFGKINELDGPVSHEFTFTNTSKTPFIIDFIAVSCGCTTPEYSKEPVLPGRTGKIKVTYDPAGRPGTFNRSIIVTSNNRKDQVRLYLKGEVEGKPRTPEDDFPVLLADGLRATSNTLLFGYMPRGKKKTQTVDIYNGGTKAVRVGAKVKNAEAAGWTSVSVSPEVLQPKGRGQITFTYDLSKADVWGLWAVPFAVTADGKEAGRPLTAYATVTEDFSGWNDRQRRETPRAHLSSQFHHFGGVDKDENLVYDVRITNGGVRDLIVRHIRTSDRSVTYSIGKTVLASGESTTLRIVMKALPRSGRMSESVTIILNEPARPMREIRLAANVR